MPKARVEMETKASDEERRGVRCKARRRYMGGREQGDCERDEMIRKAWMGRDVRGGEGAG